MVKAFVVQFCGVTSTSSTFESSNGTVVRLRVIETDRLFADGFAVEKQAESVASVARGGGVYAVFDAVQTVGIGAHGLFIIHGHRFAVHFYVSPELMAALEEEFTADAQLTQVPDLD